MREHRNLFALLLLAVMLLTAACGQAAGTDEAPATQAAESQAELPPQAETATEDFESSACYRDIKNTLEENFTDFEPNISYDAQNRLIQIRFTAPAGTANAIAINPAAVEKDWTNLCDNLNEVARNVYQLCTQSGYSVGCTIMVLNDANPDQVLFACLNGETFYNCMEDVQ